MLGAVGAYDWAGGVFIYGADGKVAFVNASEGEGGVSDAYLGESLGVLCSSGGLWVGGYPHGGLGSLMRVFWLRVSPWGYWESSRWSWGWWAIHGGLGIGGCPHSSHGDSGLLMGVMGWEWSHGDGGVSVGVLGSSWGSWGCCAGPGDDGVFMETELPLWGSVMFPLGSRSYGCPHAPPPWVQPAAHAARRLRH